MPRSSSGLRLLVGGSSFDTWLSAELDADIFTEADAWSVRASAPSADLVDFFREGQRMEMYLGDDRQLAGVIDEVKLSGNRQRETLALSGRDLGAFLLDCEAQSIRASKLTLFALIKKLLDPSWGVRNVLSSFERDRKLVLGKKDRHSKAGVSRSRGAPVFGDPPRATSAIDPGQRVAQILNDRTRQLACAWWITAGGDLFIGKPNYDQEPSFRFVCQPGSANVLDWEVVRSMSDRYSEITVVGQGSSAGGWLAQPTSVKGAKFKVTVKDPDLAARGIKRTLIVADNDVQSRADAQRRAESEMGHRRLQGLTIRLTVPEFKQADRIYAIDTIAQVKIPSAKIDGLFYVTQRRFMEERSGRRTQLTLHQPKVWLA